MNWLAKRRFNYIDGMGLSASTILLDKGLYFETFLVSVVFVVVSVFAELKYRTFQL